MARPSRPWAGAAPDAVPGLGGGGVRRPGVPEEGLAAPVLVGRLVGLPVKRASRIAGIDLRCLRTHLAQPVEEVGQVGNDVAGVLRRTRRPAQAAWVESRLAVEGSGVKPLGKVLEQAVGIALGGVRLEVFKEHPDRAGYLRHPGETAVMAAIQAIVEQRLKHTGWRQQGGNLCGDARGVGIDAGLDGHEHAAASVINSAKATWRWDACGGASTALRATSTSPTRMTWVFARVMAV